MTMKEFHRVDMVPKSIEPRTCTSYTFPSELSKEQCKNDFHGNRTTDVWQNSVNNQQHPFFFFEMMGPLIRLS